MIDYDQMYSFVVGQITSEYEEYSDDPDKFIRNSIEEFSDNSDEEFITNAYDIIRDNVETSITEYETKWL